MIVLLINHMAKNKLDAEKEFPDELVGEWILNRVCNDASVLDAFSVVNNPNWYADEKIGFLIKIVIASYKKHGTTPTRDAIVGNIKYLCSSKAVNYDENELIAIFDRVTTTPIGIDTDTVNEAIELFVANSGLYSAFNDLANSKLGVTNKKITISKTVAEVHKFEEFSLDNNIGLDYFSTEGQDEHWNFLCNPEAKLRTGLTWIDKITEGGIYRNGHFLGVITAAPNVGKSLILANMAYNFLEQDLTVLIISLEMSQQVYARRMTGLITDSCIDTLYASVTDCHNSIEAFKKAHPHANLIIKDYPTGSATPMTIDSYIEGLKRKGINPDVVILDYLNLLKPSQFHYQGDKQYIQIGYITKEIRGLSTKYEIPFFSATQSNRSGYDNTEVGLSNISQSTAVAEDADFIISAFSFDEDIINGIIKMKVIKSRLGKKDYPTHQYQIDKSTLRLIDKGDAVIDNSVDAIDLSEVISKSSKKKGEHTTEHEFSKSIVDDNTVKNKSSNVTITSISNELDEEFSFS